jgi:hypothetical protein
MHHDDVVYLNRIKTALSIKHYLTQLRQSLIHAHRNSHNTLDLTREINKLERIHNKRH